jgi:hypothetical protein
MEQERLTQKCSTIFIATGGGTRIYHSLEEVPPKLRERLVESTRGLNSATILIADRRGREEILRALNSPRSEFDRRLAATLVAQRAARRASSGRRLVRWPELVRLAGFGLLAYFLWTFVTAQW